MLKLKWRVMKQNDIADTSVFIRDSKNPLDIVYQITLPYFKRTLEVDLKAIKSKEKMPVKSYHVCLVSKTSRNGVRKFYPEQCRELDGSSATGDISKANNFLLLLALIVYVWL